MALVDPGYAQELKASLRLPVAARIFSALAIVTLIGVAWRFRHDGNFTHPETLVKAAGNHAAAAIGLFLLIYVVAAAAGIPTLPLNLAAGWLWGSLMGGALSAVAAASGATLAFGAARTIFGQPLRKRFGNRFLAWAQNEFERKGWRFVAFIRLNPIFPTGPLNYLFGLTSIRARTFVWATAVFLLPPAVVVAWVGSELGHMGTGANIAQIMRTALVVSAAITLLASIAFGAGYLNHALPGKER